MRPVLLVLAACAGGARDSDVPDPPVPSSSTTPAGTAGGTSEGLCGWSHIDWSDDGQSPTDSDGDGLNDQGCGDTLTTCIADPLQMPVWDFGMAETDGWTGEDCLNGYGAVAVCHTVSGLGETTLLQVCRPDQIVAGQTTLLDAEKDPFLTYYFHEGGECFVFGDDVDYYDSLGCTTL